MNFFKRATTSITRRPGKTVILMLLVFILGSVTAGAISVRGAIQNTDANLRARMQPLVSISEDWQAWHESETVQRWEELIADMTWQEQDEIWADPNHPLRPYMPQQEQLRPSHIRAVGALPYVADFDYVIRSSLQSFTLERYPESWQREGEPEWYSLTGTSSTNMVQFEQGIIELVQGNQFSNEDLIPGGNRAAAIVSESWATNNNLSLGSVFEMYRVIYVQSEDMWDIWGPERYEEENIFDFVTVEFVIVGLYDIPIDEDENDPWQRENNLNAIYVPNWVLEDVSRREALANVAAMEDAGMEVDQWWLDRADADDEHQMRVIPLFILEDPGQMAEFREAATALIPNYLQFEDMSSAFDDIESSMATMDTISFWILWVSIGATLLILTLLITLFLRDRRYEMGVYLALGEKKGRIVSQILMEVVVTALVGITFAVFAGHFISSAMSNNMLMNELQANREPTNDWHGGWGMGNWSVFDEIGIPTQEMSIQEMAEAFQVRLGADTILMFYGIGIGAVVLSTMIPVIYVVTLKPKKVLM